MHPGGTDRKDTGGPPMAHRNRPPSCTCNNSGRCGYCPSIAVTATREARLPASDPGRQAAERIERRSTRNAR